MMYKVLQIFILVTFFWVFGYFYGDRYWEFSQEARKETLFQETNTQALSNFELEDISTLWESISLWSTPSTELLEKLVREIDEAKERVYVEVYIFTERDLRDALVRAHIRWVEVKVLLENNPYKAPYLNDSHYELFSSEWLDVKWSDPLNYSLNHAKLLVVDEIAYISTWNFSYSTFTKNRDFFIELRNSDIVEKLVVLFQLDFTHELSWVFHPQLIVSPYSSRYKIENLVLSAQETIDFYFPYIADQSLEDILKKKGKSWVRIRAIVSESFSQDEDVLLQNLQKSDWDVSVLKKPKVHAKALLIDKKYLYIGSVNFSTYSFDENREIGLILTDKNIIEAFLWVFESDF